MNLVREHVKVQSRGDQHYLREIIKLANEDFYKEDCLCLTWPELLQLNRKHNALLCETGMFPSSPQRVPDEIFLFNQGNEKITEGRYSLRRCLNPVVKERVLE